MDIVKGYLFGIGYAFLCLLLSLIIYKCGVSKRITRKIVHILVGFEWVILYRYMGAGIHFLAVCVFFLLVLTVAYRKKLMPMISSDEGNSPGTVYYAVAMTGVATVACFVPELMLPFGIGIFCTSIGDGAAGLVGQYIRSFNPKIYKNKTLLGAVANFTVSFISALVMDLSFDIGLDFWHFAVIGAVSAGLELVTGFGLDNISVTWGITLLAYAFMYFPEITEYVIPIVLTPYIICFAIEKKALTRGGVIAALALDLCVSVSLGNFGFVMLVSFLMLGVLVDKIKSTILKRGRNDTFQKRECRSHTQVLANGSVSALCALMYFASYERIFLVAFVASLAEALADTSASGIGVSSRYTYDIFRMKKCEKGLSGGVSFIGTLASLVASYGMALIGYAFGVFDLGEVLIVTAAGFFGCLFDSLLGSIAQAKYRCVSCGKIIESKSHCGEDAERISGFTHIDNDTVNLMSCIFAAIFAAVLYILF